MSNTHWSEALLDDMRLVGDAPADRAVAALFDAEPDRAEWSTIHRLLDSLVSNDAPLPSDLPAALTEYLERTERVPAPALPSITEGERLFADQGPEILMVLGCFSLPAAYSAAKGARVLCRTEFLEKAARLRLLQTAQMIVDVMAPGGLAPCGRGIRTVQKVRLFHAAIRHLLLTDSAQPWDSLELGVPINQEDLAGTLLTFSCLILEGLERLDIHVPARQQEAYFDAWRAVGRLIGIADALIPDTIEDGRALMDLIQQRQVAPSPEGIRLTAALLEAMSQGPFGVHAPANGGMVAHVIERLARHEFQQMAVVLMRHLLMGERDRHGQSVADLLQIPAASGLSEHILDIALRLGGSLDSDANRSALRRQVLRRFNMALIDWMISMQLGPERDLFSVPATLYSSWQESQVC